MHNVKLEAIKEEINIFGYSEERKPPSTRIKRSTAGYSWGHYNKEPPVIISQYEKDEQPNRKIGEEH